VELLSEIFLLALAPSLPHTCRYIYEAIKSCPPYIHAQYICGRHPVTFSRSAESDTIFISGKFLAEALRYPICTLPVLKAILRIGSECLHNRKDVTLHESHLWTLPRRLFRHLGGPDVIRGADSEPLPVLEYLWQKRDILDFAKPWVNSNRGYPLVRAVHARFIPLIRFLLEHWADPAEYDALAIRMAIRMKDEALVRMLIEVEPEVSSGSKKRRRNDRIEVTPALLDVAAKEDARDIVRYFMEEKGCIPNMKTLQAICSLNKPRLEQSRSFHRDF